MRFPRQQFLHVLPLLTFFSASAQAQSPVVSPADRVQLEGSTFTHLPLGRWNARMQTLHRDVPGGTVIAGHAYRREAAGVLGAVAGFACDLEVSVSMSPTTPDQASTSFGNNAGPSPIQVLPRQVLTFPGTSRPAVDPAPTFEVVVPWQTPFVVPPQGGTLCVDVTIHGNSTPGGNNRNFNVYLDGHLNHGNGDAEQPGYRYGSGCAAPGGTATTYAGMTLWHLGASSAIDLALRNGVAEDGSGLARAWLALGLAPASLPWPLAPACTLYSSSEVWFVLPGLPTAQGSYDGTLGQLPVLPPGHRLWCQAGSAHLGTGALAFGDGTTIVTPPPGPLPIPTCRIANSNDRNGTTGTVSYAVPVTLFF